MNIAPIIAATVAATVAAQASIRNRNQKKIDETKKNKTEKGKQRK